MKNSLSLLSANLLFLLTMLLVLTLGSAVQYLHLSLGLIATEIFLILLPALLFLRLRRVPLKAGLRLNPISLRTAIICLLLGICAYLFSALIDGLMLQLTGMPTVPVPQGSLPATLFDGLLYFIAFAISAPICEEILFRGAVQGSYENHNRLRTAIVLPALMFAFYHFRLSGLPALLPVAFILGYVAWRTQSIYATMLIHFGMNGSSALNTLAYMLAGGRVLLLVSLWSALAATLVCVVLLIVLKRTVKAPEPVDIVQDAAGGLQPRRSWLQVYWPLLGAGLLYLGVAWATLASSPLLSKMGPAAEVSYNFPTIDHTSVSRYQITNRAGDVVGELSCMLTPQGAQFKLDCTRTIKAYQVQLGNSYYADGDHTAIWTAVWDSKTVDLLSFRFERKATDGSGFQFTIKDGELITTSPEGEDRTPVKGSTLLDYEWPWRLYLLKTELGPRFKVSHGYAMRWDEQLKKSLPTLNEELISLSPMETLTLPAGSFRAWKVSLAGQAAWYAENDPDAPRPVQFNDGMVTYSLQK